MPNGNDRGNTADRRRRLEWIFATYGNAGIVTCTFCAVPMLPEDCCIDRIVPKWQGGRYVRGNIQPSCKPCQDEQGGRMSWQARRHLENL